MTDTGRCFATVKFSFGDVEEAAYNELWEGAAAIYWICVREKHQDGVSTGHGMCVSRRDKDIWAHQVIFFAGRNGRLQVHLGYPEVLPKVVDTQ